MYAMYKRHTDGVRWHYRYLRKICLFGCHAGQIPKLMLQEAPSGQTEPYQWRLDVPAALARPGKPDSTIIINLKPSQQHKNLSLYEVLGVWGYTNNEWTPVMMHLRGLFVDADPRGINAQDFAIDDATIQEPIFSVTYMQGGLKDGKLTGPWTAPPRSPTNGALMWPEVMEYFWEEAKKVMAAIPKV